MTKSKIYNNNNSIKKISILLPTTHKNIYLIYCITYTLTAVTAMAVLSGAFSHPNSGNSLEVPKMVLSPIQ